MDTEDLFGKIYRTNLDFRIIDLIEKFERGEIKTPHFQRKFFWDSKISSRFIESIILGMPVPAILMTVNDEFHYEIVDGLNRLKSISDFHNNLFKITGLELITDINGKYFSEFDQIQKRRFLNYTISCNIIELENNLAIYEIFARLNSGGASLNKIDLLEITENGQMISGYIDSIIERLYTENNQAAKTIQKFGRNGVKDIVYNFVILRDNYYHYRPPMAKFVTSLRHNEFRNDTVDSFFAALRYIEEILSDKAFRTSSKADHYLSLHDGDLISMSSELLSFGKLSRRLAESQIIAFSKIIIREDVNVSHLKYDLFNLYSDQFFKDALQSGNTRSGIINRIRSQLDVLGRYGEVIEGFN